MNLKERLRHSSLVQWLIDDVIGTFYQRYYELKDAEDRLMHFLFDYVLPTTLGLMVGLILVTVNPALMLFLSSFGTLAFGALTGGLGVACMLAIPMLIGGVMEAGLRIQHVFDENELTNPRMWMRVAVASLAALIINLPYGVLRTGWNLLTCKGYTGSVYATISSVEYDLYRDNKMSEYGGGSLLNGAVPPVIDRLVVAPLLGFCVGVVTAFKMLRNYKSGNFSWIYLIPSMPFVGIYRGILDGSRAAWDTYEFYENPASKESSNDKGPKESQATLLDDASLSSTEILSQLSLDVDEPFSKYDYAKSMGIVLTNEDRKKTAESHKKASVASGGEFFSSDAKVSRTNGYINFLENKHKTALEDLKEKCLLLKNRKI